VDFGAILAGRRRTRKMGYSVRVRQRREEE
jgi:hypothetical protein